MTADREPLEELLMSQPYLEDEGFTERTLRALPPRRRPLRLLALGLSGAIAAVLTALYVPGAARELGTALAAWRPALAWPGDASLGTALSSAPGMALVGAILAGLALLVGLALARD